MIIDKFHHIFPYFEMIYPAFSHFSLYIHENKLVLDCVIIFLTHNLCSPYSLKIQLKAEFLSDFIFVCNNWK